MATSTNYLWTEPNDSDLVKNGALAIRTLGDAIDTSVWNIGFGQAGKNKLINGDFLINQRNFSSVTSSQYGFDRWNYIVGGGTTTYSAQTFTVGTAPVSGYEGKNFARLAATGQSAAGDYVALQQRIESVRTFAAQTATVSFWAKASSGTPSIGITLEQNFGSGGSATVTTSSAAFAITTSWVRYSKTITVPSITGKTVGANDFLACMIFQSTGATLVALGYPNTGIQNATIDYWGVQVESGSFPTPFQTASGGNLQSELAMCQRYYFRTTTGVGYGTVAFGGIGATTTAGAAFLKYPVTMRTNPASIDYSTLAVNDTAAITAITSVTINQATPDTLDLTWNCAAGIVPFRPYKVVSNNTTAGYLGVSAEL